MQNETLDEQGLAEYLHIGRYAAHLIMRQEGFPSFKMSKAKLWVRSADLEAWIEAQKQKRSRS